MAPEGPFLGPGRQKKDTSQSHAPGQQLPPGLGNALGIICFAPPPLVRAKSWRGGGACLCPLVSPNPRLHPSWTAAHSSPQANRGSEIATKLPKVRAETQTQAPENSFTSPHPSFSSVKWHWWSLPQGPQRAPEEPTLAKTKNDSGTWSALGKHLLQCLVSSRESGFTGGKPEGATGSLLWQVGKNLLTPMALFCCHLVAAYW